MPSSSKKLIPIGKLIGAYGIKGWVKVISYTEPLTNILSYKPWVLIHNNQPQELAIVDAKIHGKNIIIHIKDCNDRDQAMQYSGLEIAIHRSQLPSLKQGEYYWTDLEGMEVVTAENIRLGKVQHILETGANDVLVVLDENNKRTLIPFLLPKVIVAIDFQSNTISVDWDPHF